MADAEVAHAWGLCTDCGYEAELAYRRVEGERYDDPEALGVVLECHCPVCGGHGNTLVTVAYYRELLREGSGE